MNLENTISTVNILPIYSFLLRYLMSEWSINIQIPFDTIRWVSSQWTAVHTEPPHGRCWLTYALSCVHKSSVGETLVYQGPFLLSPSKKVRKLQQTSLKLLTNQILLFCFHLAVNACTVRLQYTDAVVSVLTINSCKLWPLNTSAWHLSEGDLACYFLDWRRWSSLWTAKTLEWVTVMITR